jgi:hypothetical protein
VDSAIQVHLCDHGYTSDQLAEAVLLNQDEFSRDFLGHEPTRDDNVVNLFDRKRPGGLSLA